MLLAPRSHGCTFISRNIRLDGKRTSIRLEQAMWDALEEIAQREDKTIGQLCGIIATRKIGSNLTAAVRLFIIVYFRIAASGAASNRSETARKPRKTGHSRLMATALSILE